MLRWNPCGAMSFRPARSVSGSCSVKRLRAPSYVALQVSVPRAAPSRGSSTGAVDAATTDGSIVPAYVANGTTTACTASTTHPLAYAVRDPSGNRVRTTTHRSGSRGMTRALLAVSWVPWSRASGNAQCRWTPAARGAPGSNGAGSSGNDATATVGSGSAVGTT